MHFASFAHPRGLLEDIGLLPPSSAPLQDDDVADSVSPRDSSGRRRAQAHVRTNAHSHAHTHARTIHAHHVGGATSELRHRGGEGYGRLNAGWGGRERT